MMKKLRWPILLALLALVVIAALLVRQQPILLPITEPVVEPASGGVYAEALIGSMMRLNPLLDYYNPADRDVDRLLFSGLVRFDDQGRPQADLADSWGISRDGRIYNFSLRANAVWHDGKPVTSDDVIFTIERLREENSPIPADIRELWEQVEVRRLDDKTLQFRLPEAFAPFLDYLTFGIAPEHLLGDLDLAQIIDSPFNLQPVGSGPYRFEQLIVENGQIVGVSLRAFQDYYGSAPFIDQVAFRYYPDGRAALEAYQRRDVLGIGEVPLDVLAETLLEPTLNLHTGRLPRLALVLMNLNNPELPFFQDVQVRQALLQGLNRQRLIDQALGGQAILADGPIFPGTWAYYEGQTAVEYNPEAAIELLKTAEYTVPAAGDAIRVTKDGVPLAFELIFADTPEWQIIAESVQKDWLRLGVEVALKPLSFEALTEALQGRLYQAALVELNLSRSPDPDPYPFWHQAQTSSGQNYSQWDDRQASEYLEQARVTFNDEERTRLYRNFQVRFAKELPALPLFYPVYRYAVDAEVQGVRMGPVFDPSDRFATLTNWFLVTKRSSGTEATPTATSTP